MAEPFKNLISADTVAQMAAHLQRAWPAFARPDFEKQATTGLEALELKARVLHITQALEATLPQDFGHAATVIEASLAPPLAIDTKGEPVTALSDVDAGGPGAGISGWAGGHRVELIINGRPEADASFVLLPAPATAS